MARVLVAISQRDHALIIQEIFDLQDHNTAQFETEAECLHAAQTTQFDVVLLGIVEGDMLAQLDLAHALHLYDPTLPLVLIVGVAWNNRPQMRKHAAKIPFRNIIHAPFSIKQLVEITVQSAR